MWLRILGIHGPKVLLVAVTVCVLYFGYGALGLIGLRYGPKLGFPTILDRLHLDQERIIVPGVVGGVVGVYAILVDRAFHRIKDIPAIPHPGFVSAMLTAVSSGIGDEVLFRLFLLTMVMWVISRHVLDGEVSDKLFWSVATGVAIVFAVFQVPPITHALRYASSWDLPSLLFGEIMVINVGLGLVASYYYRKFGILAAITMHFASNVVWHVLWGRVAQ